MSGYTVLSAVSKALRSILLEGFQQQPPLADIVKNESVIVFANPTETARNSSNRLSIWLYQVTENEFVKNQPPVRGNGGHTLTMPPLAINLHFLITPFGDTPDASLMLLGEVMQVLYDNAIVVIKDDNDDVFEELRIMICRLTLEELTRVWEALLEPYRLSICYEVRVMHINSNRVMHGSRVVNLAHGLSMLIPEGNP